MKKILLLLAFASFFFGCEKTETEVLKNPPVQIPSPTNLTSDVVVIKDVLEDKKIVIAGNEKDLYIVSFEREIDGTELNFKPSLGPLPAILEDDEGNKWDIFGHAVSGPRLGQNLKPTESLMGYWFSFATFYPGIEIYNETDRGSFEGKTITGTDDWLVPKNEVRSGGVGKDGIPAIMSPKFENVKVVEFLNDSDLVVGISSGNVQKAYPHNALDWHEIVNDRLKDAQYSIIYCPLTGTATAWDRNVNGILTSFGVSGLLYN